MANGNVAISGPSDLDRRNHPSSLAYMWVQVLVAACGTELGFKRWRRFPRRRRIHHTMEKTTLSSALFAGTRFDRKRFAGDIARFRKGAQPPAPAPDVAEPPPTEKKRTRKSKIGRAHV